MNGIYFYLHDAYTLWFCTCHCSEIRGKVWVRGELDPINQVGAAHIHLGEGIRSFGVS